MSDYAEMQGRRGEPDSEPSGDVVVLVCVGYNPSSQRLIRRAYNLAHAFGGRLIALHMARPSSAPGYEVLLEENMALARDLGATTLIVQGHDLASEIAQVAKEQQVTHLVMGKSARTRWDDWRAGSIMRQVLHVTSGVDLYIVANPE